MIRKIKRMFYFLLVNKIPGIRQRYRWHQNKQGKYNRIISYLLLLWWNFLYYSGLKKNLMFPQGYDFYERKRLVLPESCVDTVPPQSIFMEKLLAFDVISFDIFDTLLLRPFREPNHLFYFVGEKLSIPDFRNLRIKAENAARKRDVDNGGSGEVSLQAIWEILSSWTGIDISEGMQAEKDAERQFCMPNPFFLPIIKQLKEAGKIVVVASDMYLNSGFLEDLLKEKGFLLFDACFVSRDFGASKWKGDLYPIIHSWIRQKKGTQKYIAAHVGDNILSDVIRATDADFFAIRYPNPQTVGQDFRVDDMSALIGSIYGGLVNIRLHSMGKRYTPFYEFGYVYGGILALGYCRFIYKFVKEKNVDSIWFLSRDGEILKKIYDILFPNEDTKYVMWSRNVGARLLSQRYRNDFFDKFFFQKVDQGYTVYQIFDSMGLLCVLNDICVKAGCKPSDSLTTNLAVFCRDYLLERWEIVQNHYKKEKDIAGQYLLHLADKASKVAIVDIGWAGSGAVSLDSFLKKDLLLPCQVYGILAGTTSVYNVSPDTIEGFLFAGRIVSYLFSQNKNRDLWKFHDLNRKHNLFVELLFTSEKPSFKGFDIKHGEIEFCYGREEKHAVQIKRIQKGIMDFVQDYIRYFPMFLKENIGEISGRDAYAPLLLFLRDKRLCKKFETLFEWDTDINVE